ncbi:uncharacterized protein LOC125062962 [Pieris napi]|uniref:uncharacterized protein LOC125062962 n=1 Tax=Pieris napi TaxID=78633 RepID=UPI001FBBA431|nr:uncharacterized protein LOC125062962 [Pieris napi]
MYVSPLVIAEVRFVTDLTSPQGFGLQHDVQSPRREATNERAAGSKGSGRTARAHCTAAGGDDSQRVSEMAAGWHDGRSRRPHSYGCMPGNKSVFEYSAKLTEEEFQERPIINWDGIVWVNRPLFLWVLQVILAMISLSEAILLAYLGYKGNIWQQILSFHFILEMVNTVPFALTLHPLSSFEKPNDLHRAMQKSQSALSQQLMILCVTLLCLVFTSMNRQNNEIRRGRRSKAVWRSRSRTARRYCSRSPRRYYSRSPRRYYSRSPRRCSSRDSCYSRKSSSRYYSRGRSNCRGQGDVSRRRRSRTTPQRSPSLHSRRDEMQQEQRTRNGEPQQHVHESYTSQTDHQALSKPTELATIFKEFMQTMKHTARVSEQFPSMNVVPEFDPVKRNQTIEMWLLKVNECATIYNWSERQVIHYALPKLSGLAQKWYQGLPSLMFSWPEWQDKLRLAFPSEDNYAQLLTEMLACRAQDRSIRTSAEAAQFSEPDKLLVYLRNVKILKRTEKNNNALKSGATDNKRQRTNKFIQMRSESTNNSKCYICSEIGHPYYKCKQPIKRCSQCHKIGHLEANCPLKKESSDAKTVLRISQERDTDLKYFKKANVNGRELDCFVDFGSQCTILTESVAKELAISWSTQDLPVLRGFGDSLVNSLGKCNVQIEVDSAKANVDVLIVPDYLLKVPLLLGQSFTEQNHILVYKTNDNLKITTTLAKDHIFLCNSELVTINGLSEVKMKASMPNYNGDRFFGEYEGKSLTYASFHSHRKYGVALVGVRPAELPEFYEETILLNPGPRHIMKASDTCYYMSITKEENSAFVVSDQQTESKPLITKDQTACSLLSSEGRRKGGDGEEAAAQPRTADGSNMAQSALPQVVLQAPATSPPNASPSRINTVSSANLTVASCECHGRILYKGDGSDHRGGLKDSPAADSATDSHLLLPRTDNHYLSPDTLHHRRVPDMVTSSFNIAEEERERERELDMSEEELEDNAHFRTKTSLNPIILLLERRPDIAFLDAISYFPLVYWMMGSIDSLDDLLRAGITLAENVVVVNKELSNSAEEDSLSDCNTIVAVQTMFKFFPSIRSITELSQSSNMRFMQFRAHDKYALHLSKMEKREKERGSHISYMFRLPFAAGSVFSASMLDTLLYQAFVKDYVITFVRLLLGVDQAPGSGFLTSMRIGKGDMWIRTYGRLYQKLCSTSCEIPIGIYRTQDTSLADPSHHVSMSPRGSPSWLWSRLTGMRPSRPSQGGQSKARSGDSRGARDTSSSSPTGCLTGCYGDRTPVYSASLADEARDNHAQQIDRAEIANLVRSRMESLNLNVIDYDDVSEKRNSLSYVIINPSCDLNLCEGDVIYLVRPSPFAAQKTFERHNSRRKSNISFCSSICAAASAGSGRHGSTLSAVRAPPLCTTKANSLSLPDSPTVLTDFRGRSNSLRVVDDAMLCRSASLRQGLGTSPRRRKSSLEEIGITHFNSLLQHQQQQQEQDTEAIKMALQGSARLEVTPLEDRVASVFA